MVVKTYFRDRLFESIVFLFPVINLITGASRSCFTGQAALTGDWTTDAPGVCRHITPADLPPPFATESASNGPRIIQRPRGAWPKVPPNFSVHEFFSGLDNGRLLRTAPNGDVFIAESNPGRIRVLRAADGAVKAETAKTFARGLEQPFGIGFHPPGPDPEFIYIANTGSVVRFPYQNGDLEARGEAETVVPDIPSGGHLTGGGHWTRDVVFNKDGKKMYVSVGSHSNVFEDPDVNETNRANILEYNPDGTGFRIFAWGLRNPVGIAVHPTTDQVWASVNERDELGDNLAPDYITHVQDGGFYGWPWYYIGPNQDPRHAGKHSELKNKVIVPDVLLQSHSASLQMTFYTGQQFPTEYHGHAFAAEHGSWNRAKRTGYKIIRVPVDQDGKASGEYEDFMTGFVTRNGNVWGRPVGVTVARDGSLLVTDDASGTVWRVSYSES